MTNQPITIKSISIASRLNIDLHALNNEGSQSNRLMTRQVGIVTPVYNEEGAITDYSRAEVNAISGDMWKHIFAHYLRVIALEESNPDLCSACKERLDPNRRLGDADFKKRIKEKLGKSDDDENDEDEVEEENLDAKGKKDKKDKDKKKQDELRRQNLRDISVDLIQTCVIDDVCGILIAEGTPMKRKSAVEFGWTAGLPQHTQTQTFVHARHDIMGDNQMIFDRPASSGVYAFVAHVDVCAIGFSEYSGKYEIDQQKRQKRLKMVLQALSQMFLNPKGAMASNQFPHMVDMDGFVSISQKSVSAPFISPLNANYKTKIHLVAEKINRMNADIPNTVQVAQFTGVDELMGQFVYLYENASAGKYASE